MEDEQKWIVQRPDAIWGCWVVRVRFDEVSTLARKVGKDYPDVKISLEKGHRSLVAGEAEERKRRSRRLH